MTAKELKRIFSKGECLSLDTMRLYNDGKLNKKIMHEVEKHLLECNLCSGAVDGLNNKRLAEVNKLSEHIQRRLAVYMNTPPSQPFFRRFAWLFISTILLISVSGTCIYLAQDHSKAPVVTDSSATQKPETTGKPVSEETSFRSGETQTVSPASLISPSQNNSSGTNSNTSTTQKIENLPADLPGQPNTFTIKQENTIPTTTSSPSTETAAGPNTRSENSPIRVKSVTIYPPVSHDGKTSRKEAKDGQLGTPSDNSTSGFQLDEMPFFPGGNEALRNYIISNFKPTMTDREKLTRFATGVRFVVNSKTGAISAPEISFSISPEIDKELMRVVNSIPDYNPGKKRGEVDIMIGITFE
jgi:hypothetical protein